jgi:N utilization substance protein B
MGLRRKGRELALQALYQIEITGDASEQAFFALWKSFDTSPPTQAFALSLVRGVIDRREAIDAIIAQAAEHWRLERLSRIDVNVIRIATHEMTSPEPLPVEIAINEAIEIARRYGTIESATFVNGVLDQVAKQLDLKRGRERRVGWAPPTAPVLGGIPRAGRNSRAEAPSPQSPGKGLKIRAWRSR